MSAQPNILRNAYCENKIIDIISYNELMYLNCNIAIVVGTYTYYSEDITNFDSECQNNLF